MQQISEPIKQLYVRLLFAALCNAIERRDGAGAVAVLDALAVQIGQDNVNALVDELVEVGLRRLASRNP